MAGETLARFAWGPTLEHADISPAGKDFAFGLHEQGSDRKPLDRGHSGAEVFDHLPAEQIERRIREREDAQRPRGFATHLIHHNLLVLNHPPTHSSTSSLHVSKPLLLRCAKKGARSAGELCHGLRLSPGCRCGDHSAVACSAAAIFFKYGPTSGANAGC